ncbi:MAG: HD domain-containing protein [Pseudobutyrivibrio sp.]|nr:HD domain-containing protein [Pseudobutyrivibrio sp.]
MEFLVYLSSYWTKIVAGCWFALMNIFLMVTFGGCKRHLIKRCLLLFCVSSAFLSIISQFCIDNVFWIVVENASIKKGLTVLFVALSTVIDAVMVLIGGILFVHITNFRNYIGAMIYMEYVCIERLCSVLAVDSLSFIVIFALLQMIFFILQRKDIPYLFDKRVINCKLSVIYLSGLFIVLDMLYGAYIIFPELSANSLGIKNIFWLDVLALLNTAFVIGYLRISITASREHEEKLTYYERLQSSQEDIIISLAEISEAKSGETGQHIRRVAEYSKLLAKELGMDSFKVENIRIASMMHDIGKLMIGQEILEKQGKLTQEEFEVMKKHTQYGWELLANSKGAIMNMARVIAAQHHEHWDGSGYPSHLKGDEISIFAQIVAVTDVYDALTSQRCYKDAWIPLVARKEIVEQRGRHFSPRVVDAFMECYSKIEEVRVEYADYSAPSISLAFEMRSAVGDSTPSSR